MPKARGPVVLAPGIDLAVVEEHVARGGGGRGLAAVEGEERAVGAADEHEAAAADAGVVAVHDAQGEGGGDGRVDGVAAASRGRRPRFGGEGLHRGDDAAGAGGGEGGRGGGGGGGGGDRRGRGGSRVMRRTGGAGEGEGRERASRSGDVAGGGRHMVDRMLKRFTAPVHPRYGIPGSSRSRPGRVLSSR